MTGLDDEVEETLPSAILRFPLSLGLTGLSARHKQILACNNLDTEIRFDSDIDNILGVTNIRNIMTFEYAIDHGRKSPIIGVIQMINKIDDGGIT